MTLCCVCDSLCIVMRNGFTNANTFGWQIGEMISVIDMPPPEESIWLRGKLTRESHEMGINFEVGFFPREYVEVSWVNPN